MNFRRNHTYWADTLIWALKSPELEEINFCCISQLVYGTVMSTLEKPLCIKTKNSRIKKKVIGFQIGLEKALEKIKTYLKLKTFSKVEIQRNVLNLEKGIHRKLKRETNTLKGNEYFLLRSRMGQGCLLSPLLFYVVLKIIVQ